ncbi:transposase [Trichonephila clavipes]|uniref:Transposase n=1 Tax=Trichonephila clavipes TaxID=2585209 RepID=A0A8X6RQW2_TRICX|nr:transposase [Trichonephila clavipes]
MPVVENVNKVTEIFEVDQHVSSRSIARELKIDHNSFKPFNHSCIEKEARCLFATPINTKNMMDVISTCEAFAKQNEINPFLKWRVTGDKKCFTYDNIGRRRSWSHLVEAAQTMVKTGLTTRKFLLCIW